MKPLGTITQCFPHVDKVARSILQSVMDEAENYADFVKRLWEKACSEKLPPICGYFAFYHAFRLDMFPQMEQLFNFDEIAIFIEPLYLVDRVVLGYEVDMNKMYKSLVKAMETIPNDWLACHLYLAWRRVIEAYDPETDTDTQIMDTIEERIKSDRNYECFEPIFIGLEAFRMMIKGYHKEAVELFEKGLALARKHNDLLLVADGLYFLAENIKKEDESRAISLILEHNRLAEEVGYSWTLARSSLVLGRIKINRGEFNAAVEHLLKHSKVIESIGHPAAYSNYSLALAYNLVRDGNNAIRYLETIRERYGIKRYIALFHLQMAFAYMNIGEEREALSHLDKAKRHAVQSGFQSYLNLHQLLEGIFEKKSGDFQSAAHSLETILTQVSEEDQLYKCLSLFHLADIEIETYPSEMASNSTFWLDRFERFVENGNMPGFAAQAKILKAKLLHKQGKQQRSQALVDEVLRVAESPGMMYLKDMISVHIVGISR